MAEPTDAEVAWAAGLFEGEGSVYLLISREGEREWKYPCLAIVSTDEDVIRRAHEIFGVGTVTVEKRNPSDTHLGDKTVYRWNVRNRPGYHHVSALLRPWLGERRSARLQEVKAEATPALRAPNKRHQHPTQTSLQ